MLAPKTDKVVFEYLINIVHKQTWTKSSYDGLLKIFNICDSRHQQELLSDLILRFEVLNGEQENNAYLNINTFLNTQKLSPDNTLIVGCGDVGRGVDGSYVGLQRMKNKLTPRGKWECRISKNMQELMAVLSNNITVIIYDDFIGSGNKILKKYQWLKDLVQARNDINFDSLEVIFASLAGMNFGIEKVKKETNCEVISYLFLKKGITDHYPYDEVNQKLLLMKKLESKLESHFDNRSLTDYSLGYSQSETLYFAENDNCPNNVFPIFWWQKLISEDVHETLLYRSD